MEVVDDPNHPGKLLVLFNGTQINCVNSLECPGAALCSYNQTWMAKPLEGMCMCNTKFGFTGYYCNEWCGQAVGILVINVLASFLGWCLAITSLYLLIRLSKRKPASKCHYNPVAVTLIFTFIGSLCFCVAAILAMFVSLGFPSYYGVVTIDNRPVKRVPQALEYANSVMFALAYCITVCSFVILPLTWIDVVESTLKLRPTQTVLVIGFTLFLVVIIIGMELPFYILTASGFRGEAGTWVLGVVIGWGIILPLIMFLNILAAFRVQTVKDTVTNSSGSEMASREMRVFLRRVQKSAIQITFAALGMLVFGSFFRARSLRTWYTDPRCYADAIDLVFRISMIFVLYGGAVAIWFVAPSALGPNKVRRGRNGARTAVGATGRTRNYVDDQPFPKRDEGSGSRGMNQPISDAVVGSKHWPEASPMSTVSRRLDGGPADQQDDKTTTIAQA